MKLIKRSRLQPSVPTFFDDFLAKDLFSFDKDFAPFKSNVAVNVRENEDAFSIDVAAPGLKKEDFNIELNHDVLTISFEQKEEKEEETNDKFTKREFNYSSFSRSFTLPEGKIDEENIDANYVDGILTLSLPKKEEAKIQAKRRIAIK